MQQSKYPKFLEGTKVYLRPIEKEDASYYYRSLYEPLGRRLTGTQKIYTEEQIERYLESSSSNSSRVHLLITLQETDETIGDIAVQDIDPTNRNANIRIALYEERHQGFGYGSEAMRLLLDYAFGVLQLHRVELNVFSYNERAVRAYEKVGFKVEGRQREALYYNYEYHDSILMAILAREYVEKYKNRVDRGG
ncbi:GNAT family N-acetyltransferase [Paenibacillus thermotolerans]|uniref:GNAT family N-acetyltransferase n=1 Tax=Paenibacillus thermotolerans TaxID=3027807 RepID=UPI002368F1B7|nr:MULTISPECIES: GNAT family protein [unclassified Paenibacillus]